MATTKDRLLQFLEHVGIGQNAFEKKVKIANGYVSHNKGSIGSTVIGKIAAVYPELDTAWLLTGEGEMLKTQTKETTPGDGFRMVPVYNFDVVGGMQAWAAVVDSPEYVERYLPFAGAKKGDICVHVTGNSMMPTYSSGSVLLVRRVEGWREYFGYGHCYVLLLNDGRRILKEIQKSEKSPEKFVLCVSHNPKNPPEELPRDFIYDVYKVIMTLTNEGF